MLTSDFSKFVNHNRNSRSWTLTELSHRASLSRAEISRVESGTRTPTLRIVKGLAAAFSGASVDGDKHSTYAEWLTVLVELGEAARIADRKMRRSA